MIYHPKILFNPKSETVEFRYDGKVHILKPGEKRLFEGIIANHALTQVNTGLVEYENQDEKPLDNYEAMPWTVLLSYAAKRGISTFGLRKEEIIKALKEKDGSQTGALPESSN